MTPDKHLEILYDHYKDTFEQQRNYLYRRNLYSVIIVCLIMILLFQVSNPSEVESLSNKLVKDNLGDVTIKYKIINSILVFCYLWIVIMYYQVNFLIEKHYIYLKKLEDTITNEIAPHVLDREGNNYLENYPRLLNVTRKQQCTVFGN